MAIGKAGASINLEKLSIKFGNINIIYKGKLHNQYSEQKHLII